MVYIDAYIQNLNKSDESINQTFPELDENTAQNEALNLASNEMEKVFVLNIHWKFCHYNRYRLVLRDQDCYIFVSIVFNAKKY